MRFEESNANRNRALVAASGLGVALMAQIWLSTNASADGGPEKKPGESAAVVSEVVQPTTHSNETSATHTPGLQSSTKEQNTQPTHTQPSSSNPNQQPTNFHSQENRHDTPKTAPPVLTSPDSLKLPDVPPVLPSTAPTANATLEHNSKSVPTLSETKHADATPSSSSTPTPSSTEPTPKFSPSPAQEPTAKTTPTSQPNTNRHYDQHKDTPVPPLVDPASLALPDAQINQPTPDHTAPAPAPTSNNQAPAPQQTPPQPFENPIVYPGARCTSKIGMRWGEMHNGYDIAAPLGTDIHAVTDGTVLYSRPASGYGNWIVIESAGGLVETYGHMKAQDLLVKQGDKVTAGEVISKVGAEGQATGPHLHLQFNQGAWNGPVINPEDVLKQHGIELCNFTSHGNTAPRTTPVTLPVPDATDAPSSPTGVPSLVPPSSLELPTVQLVSVDALLLPNVTGQSSAPESPAPSSAHAPAPAPAPTSESAPAPSPTTPAEQAPGSRDIEAVRPLLEIIGKGESDGEGGYNAYFNPKNLPPVRFTGMTVGQVLEWQVKYIDPHGGNSKSSAVGRYQFISTTLQGLVHDLGIDPNTLFNEQLQDRLALALMRRRGLDGFLGGKLGPKEFAHNLACEWASLPSEEGPHPDNSVYEGDGLNHAIISTGEIMGAISKIKKQ